ncbi:hypothetical protein CKM354_000615300 [Cercospora kikuchii]|uniref:dihydroneopterin aldolase n=1 Tax=Cercospora kikuchii TaxID=84275 RepID=A0A9P3CLX8_9PEZI|nr:uncharacterized protein CKM354_000615300 [Cercospora kikuchii]GIZ42905.1 hypothetical protein CKM354_000615300 [Cercospora kikuchii]
MAATESAQSSSQDKIEIQGLQLPSPVLAPDVWGNQKEQPATVNVKLLLRSTFQSASEKDKLDDSTIHYGNLAKAIRSNSTSSQTVGDVLSGTEQAVYQLALKGEGNFVVKESAVEVHLPKGSMLGSEAVVSSRTTWDQKGGRQETQEGFEVRDVAIPTLIGVNAYERGLKQPLVVTFGLEWRTADQQSQQKEALFALEKEVVNIVQETAYETLETLVEYVYAQLRRKTPQALSPGSRFRLRIEKPRAIAFADAPVIEIQRTVPAKHAVQSSIPSHDALSVTLAGLSVVKPYSG